MTLIGELVKYVMTPFVPLLRILEGLAGCVGQLIWLHEMSDRKGYTFFLSL